MGKSAASVRIVVTVRNEMSYNLNMHESEASM